MHAASEFIFNFALNACWQIVAIFAVAALASWLLRNGPARYRHTLWVVSLIACLVVPLLTATRFVPEWVSSVQVVAPQTAPVQTAAEQSLNNDFSVEHLVTRRTRPVSTTTRTALFLALAYVLVVVFRGIRLARFWRRKEMLRRSAISAGLPPEIELIAKRCRTIFRVDAAVTWSDKARVPYTIGARPPLILLPTAFCSGADETRLLSVIGHEMAHVARRDFLSNLICELISLPIAFHPLTFVIKRQIDRTRELACDELVTSHVLAPRVYARSLLWAADVSRQYSSQAFMLSIFDGKILEERIMRLTRNNSRLAAGPARVLMLAALSLLCVSAISVSMFGLELQTRASVLVQPLQVLTQPAAAAQEPVAQPVVTSEPRQQPQLNAPTAEDRAKSACDAGRRGDAEAIPSLITLLGDDTKTQFVNCWDSGRWSPALQTFKHPSPGEQAAIALASFGRRTLVPLTNQLDSPNATVRRNAAWAIGELTAMIPGERAGAVPQLITLLSDSDEWVRMAAARSLGEVRDRRSVDGLIARLGDDKWRVRQVTAWALSEMKDARAVPALCSVLLSDQRAEVRRGAAEALGEIASSEALASLKQALNDTESSVSAKAAWAIAEIEG
ncbi:MAG TPA: M56 family metallopeptidase [Pyrinomonadaceae bacterium]|nr:M56 family metallopeptidase [Pyrinomonadaceae bacterium]